MPTSESRKPKEEVLEPISADLDELILNNDEDTTKTLDETAMVKSRGKDAIHNKFDGSYEDQLGILNKKVKQLTLEVFHEKKRYEKLNEQYTGVKIERDKLKRTVLKNCLVLQNLKARFEKLYSGSARSLKN